MTLTYWAMIDTYSTSMTIADFYQYGSPDGASYNGHANGSPATQNGLSQVFFVDASDGLSMAVVHDSAHDGSGGRAITSWSLSNDTAGFVVRDDPGESYSTSGGGTSFATSQLWVSCCTDGFAIGSLENNWEMIGSHTLNSVTFGITDWQATSADGNDITLALVSGLNVRFDTVQPASAPATLALIGLGLLGLTRLSRKVV